MQNPPSCEATKQIQLPERLLAIAADNKLMDGHQVAFTAGFPLMASYDLCTAITAIIVERFKKRPRRRASRKEHEHAHTCAHMQARNKKQEYLTLFPQRLEIIFKNLEHMKEATLNTL